MKRLILCAIIGALLAGSSVLSLRYMRTSCDQLTGQLEKEPLLELMIRHQHLDEAAEGIRALSAYISHDSPVLFFAEADKIRFCLRDIWEKETFSLENLL